MKAYHEAKRNGGKPAVAKSDDVARESIKSDKP